MTLAYNEIKSEAKGFLEKMRVGKEWAFRFSSANQPNLIGSSLAVMLAALLDWLATLTNAEKESWAEYLNSFQQEEGFFVDEDISDVNRISGYTRERALFHRSRHALFALTALGFKPRYNFVFLQDKFQHSSIEKWMQDLNLADFWDASNKIMDLALFLTYEAVANKNRKAREAIWIVLDICDKNTNPDTGYQDAGKSELRNAMAGAMHIYPLYFLWGRKPKYPEKIIKATLSLQQEDGFFSYDTGTCGEDCLDYDAVNILVNFSFMVNEYAEDIRRALERLIATIENCKNADGGFCAHRRKEKYRFGTTTTEVPVGGSNLWSTYSRILTIAMATKLLKGHPAYGNWNLGNNIMEIWDGATAQMPSYHNFNNLKSNE